MVIGSGPVRIGQGIEFDYCAVRAAERLTERGWSAVMVNSNPETVSTDFDASTRLYFEPLDAESIMEIVRAESPEGETTLPAFVQFGGQTPLNLAAPLAAAGVPLLGASLEAIEETEDRVRVAALGLCAEAHDVILFNRNAAGNMRDVVRCVGMCAPVAQGPSTGSGGA